MISDDSLLLLENFPTGKNMLIFAATTTTKASCCSYSGCSMISQQQRHHNRGEAVTCIISSGDMKRRRFALRLVPMQMITAAAVSAVSLAVILAVVDAGADAMEIGRRRQQQQQQELEETGTLSNVPQTLSADCISGDCKKARVQRPKSRKAEVCTVRCVTTCIRGGLGSPGEGPLNVRRPLVVFKQGFRSRQYCLAECSDICNLIGDGDDGP